MKGILTGIAVGLALAFSATTAAGDAEPAGVVSFEADLMPLLKRRCAACHITGDEPGKMALVPGKAYGDLVGVPSVGSRLNRVEPGDPSLSYLIHKLEGTHVEVGGSGVRMPFHQPPLPQRDIDNFRDWIAQGAKQN